MKIPVSLTLEDWNRVVNMLAVNPYNQVAPLMQNIMAQVQAHAKSAPQSAPEEAQGGGLPS